MEELFKKSIEVLLKLQQENGGILATFSDDAYPYVYPRDAAIITRALNAVGYFENSKKFYLFLNGLKRRDGEIFQRYNNGLPCVTQKGEHDITPLVLFGIGDTYEKSGDKEFLKSMWNVIVEGSNFIATKIDPKFGLPYTTRSIHELRELEQGHEIWCACAAAKGLKTASFLAKEFDHSELADVWEKAAENIIQNILDKLYDKDSGFFIKAIRPNGEKITSPDISQLSPFYFGLIEDNKILENTLNYLKENIWNNEVGGFKRFRDFENVKNWHWYTGGIKDAWPIFTIWCLRFYQKLGKDKEIKECEEFLSRAITEEFFIPERISPIDGYNTWKENEIEFNDRILRGIARVESNKTKTRIQNYRGWACPLGWAHAEYILFWTERICTPK